VPDMPDRRINGLGNWIERFNLGDENSF